jgi:3-hydroxyisobutyrate dehydrogenase-like beta-hydroxyacid dehydrogenase
MGRQRTFDKMGTRVLPGKFDSPALALPLVHKDVQPAPQLARELKVPMRLCDLAGQEISEALNRGWANATPWFIPFCNSSVPASLRSRCPEEMRRL